MLRHLYFFQAVLVVASWGGNFIAARLSLNELSPMLQLSIRFVAVFVLLYPFFPKPAGKWRDLLILSFLLGSLHFTMMYVALYLGLDVTSSVISSQLGIPFSCLLSSIFLKDSIGRWRALGIVVAMFGIVIICGSPRIMEQYWQFMISCCAALAWAGGNIFIKRFHNENILGVLCWMSALCAPQLALMSWLLEDQHMQQISNASMTAWLAVSYTILFSTIIAYGLWYSLMTRHSVSQIVPFSLLVPVFGLTFAQLAFDEPTSWQFYAGTAFTLAGVAIIIFRRPSNSAAHTGAAIQPNARR